MNVYNRVLTIACKGVKLWKNWNVCVVMENMIIMKVAANVESVIVFVLSSKQKARQWRLSNRFLVK